MSRYHPTIAPLKTGGMYCHSLYLSKYTTVEDTSRSPGVRYSDKEQGQSGLHHLHPELLRDLYVCLRLAIPP